MGQVPKEVVCAPARWSGARVPARWFLSISQFSKARSGADGSRVNAQEVFSHALIDISRAEAPQRTRRAAGEGKVLCRLKKGKEGVTQIVVFFIATQKLVWKIL